MGTRNDAARHPDNGRSRAAERGRTLAAHGQGAWRSLCEKAAVHRQEPAAHQLVRQLGHEGKPVTRMKLRSPRSSARPPRVAGIVRQKARGPLEAGVHSRTQVSGSALPSFRAMAPSRALAGQVHGVGGATRPPNKEMKLTSAERIGRSQLISGVRRTVNEPSTVRREGDE